MNNENSQQFLINKKIAQLIKLINNLNTLNAEREHNILFLTKKIDEQFNQSCVNYIQLLQKTYEECKLINENSKKAVETEYKNHLHQLEFDFLNNIAKSRENINDTVFLFESTTSQISETMKSITEKIDIFSQKAVQYSDQLIINIRDQVQKLNEQYQKEISLIDSESNAKIKNYEFESNKKLNELTQNFNHLNQSDDLQFTDLNQKRSLNDLKIELIQLKSSILEIKQKFQFFINKTQNIFYLQRQKFQNIIKDDMNQHSKHDQESNFEHENFELNSHLFALHENKQIINEKEKKKHEELMTKTTDELNQIIEEKERKKSTFLSIFQNHKNERNFHEEKHLQKENEYKNRIADNANDAEQLIDDLLNEKENLMKIKTEKLEFKRMIEYFERDKMEITDKLNEDLNNAKKRGKLMIDAVSDTHRNEIFVKNNELARIYDNEIERTRKENRKSKLENEINSFYQTKLNELEKELKEDGNEIKQASSPSSSVNDKECEIAELDKAIEKLKEKKKSKLEFIDSLRKEINESFIKQEKDECTRHEKLMKENQDFILHNLNQFNNEVEKIQNSYHSKFEQIESSIKQHQIYLAKEKRKNAAKVAEIKEEFDSYEEELRREFNKIKTEKEEQIDKINKIEANRKEFINQEIIQVKEKIQCLKETFKKSKMVEGPNIDSNQIFTIIQEKYHETEIFLNKTKSDKIRNLQNDHREKMKFLSDQISTQKVNNKHDKTKDEEQEKENPHILNKQLESFKRRMIEEIQTQKIKYETEIKELEQTIYELNQKKSKLKTSIDQNDIRPEDQIIIEKLENEITMLDQHIKDISFDLTNYQKKIVTQENSYNTQFGTTPTVAVLRPKTGYGQMNIRGSLRPNTTIRVNRTKSLMKNQSNKCAVHF